MRLALETSVELSRVPLCEEERLMSLASDYTTKVNSIRQQLREKSSVIKPYCFHRQDNYDIRREVEALEIANGLGE